MFYGGKVVFRCGPQGGCISHCTCKVKQVLYWNGTLADTVRSKECTGNKCAPNRRTSRLHASVKRSRLAIRHKKYQAFIIISHQGHEDGVEVVVRCRKVAETPRELEDKGWQNIDARTIAPTTGSDSRPWAEWSQSRKGWPAKWVPSPAIGTWSTCPVPGLASIRFPCWPAVDARARP